MTDFFKLPYMNYFTTFTITSMAMKRLKVKHKIQVAFIKNKAQTTSILDILYVFCIFTFLF